MREFSSEELIHDQLGDRFRESLSDYDTQRRVETLIDEFLGPARLRDSTVLDVGCGYGFFSARMAQLGAQVTACDISDSLLQQTRQLVGCRTVLADALNLTDVFAVDSFDLVVSSECIEHTPDPAGAIAQMVAVCRPGGWLSISTPNILWYPVVAAATRLKLRPFCGLENFSSFGSLQRDLQRAGADIVRKAGLHLYPFQIPAHSLSFFCDRRLQCLKPLMINLCVLARKRDGQEVH